MPKKFRPTSPGRRQLVLPSTHELEGKPKKKQINKDKSEKETTALTGRKKKKAEVKIKPGRPEKSLLLKKTRTNGRNNLGRITCRHRGGGHKRKYRLVDFKRNKFDVPAKVASIEYDPNRSAHIALLNYVDGEKRYILAPQKMRVGDTVVSGEKASFSVGCAMPLSKMPLGSTIHNLEINPGRGGQMVRSAGQSAELIARDGGYAIVRLPSGEMRKVPESCMATFGVISNSEHSLRKEGKAGRMRWKGIRPTVRGTAMNPVDHPHGGGEGKNSGGIPRTPWGQMTKGKRTRNKKKSSSKLIVKSRRD